MTQVRAFFRDHLQKIAGSLPAWFVVPLVMTAFALVLIAAPSSAAPSSPHITRPPGKATYEKTKIVELRHPVSIRNALVDIARSQASVTEVRAVGDGIVGGIIPSSEEPPVEQAEQAELAFRSAFQQIPVVTSVIVDSATTTSEIKTLRQRLAEAPSSHTKTAPPPVVPSEGLSESDFGARSLRSDAPVSESREAYAVQTQAQDIPNHFPSTWRGAMFSALFSTSPEQRVFDYSFSYESATGASPQLFPDDWGLELGVTTYNYDLSSEFRPNCGLDGGDSNTDFWQQNYTTGAVWVTDAPSASAPYLDTNVALDSCQANSIEIELAILPSWSTTRRTARLST